MAHTAELDLEMESLTITQQELGELLEKEWLLSNQRGSYASGTVVGCNTRRYHGMLVAAMSPPVERIVALSNLLERVTIAGQPACELANFEFSDQIHPQGYHYLKSFRQDEGVHFLYQLDENITIEKSIYLSHEKEQVLVNYDFSGCHEQVTLQLMPMIALRDFHSLQLSSASLTIDQADGVVTAHGMDPPCPALHLFCRGAQFKEELDWWYNLNYRQDKKRGQQSNEDLWACGTFQVSFNGDKQVTLVAQATRDWQQPGSMDVDLDELIQTQRQRRRELLDWADARDKDEETLVLAADQFIVRRQVQQIKQKESSTILAGFHWFSDWGRDTFVALPGLLLKTGRYAEAKEVLATFAAVVDQGQIPNRFDDYGGPPHYNSVDASLWFINAAYQYLCETDDRKTFERLFLEKIKEIAHFYQRGTRDNIHADSDGLISAGDDQTQLTWMDARCNGVSFTPRYGKAVEINALWINALYILAKTVADENQANAYLKQAQKAQRSFRKVFWNEQTNGLDDCVYPDGGVDQAIRPNQIFAVSLPFSPLTKKQQKAVVETVQEHLLTPYGLRSLSPHDSRYQPCYSGDQFQRDNAYHQGTVWGFLIGPFIEAFLKVNQTQKAQSQAKKMLEPLLQHLHQTGCLKSINEIFDAQPPHQPKGCIAQAWSVAELLRAKKMLNE